MKKALLIIGAIVTVIAIGIACLGIYAVRTPEYALVKIAGDIKASGADGLRPHLTEEARQTLDVVKLLTDDKLAGVLMGLLGQNDYVSILKAELQQVQWELIDIIKSDTRAEVIVGFNYDDRLAGTIAITMIRDDGEWKIDGLELPKFDRIDW